MSKGHLFRDEIRLILLESPQALRAFSIVCKETDGAAVFANQWSDLIVLALVVCEDAVVGRKIIQVDIDGIFAQWHPVQISGQIHRLAVEFLHVLLQLADPFQRWIGDDENSVPAEFLAVTREIVAGKRSSHDVDASLHIHVIRHLVVHPHVCLVDQCAEFVSQFFCDSGHQIDVFKCFERGVLCVAVAQDNAVFQLILVAAFAQEFSVTYFIVADAG